MAHTMNRSIPHARWASLMISVLSLTASAALTTGCNGENGTKAIGANGPFAQAANASVIGDSCAGSGNLCLAVNYVVYKTDGGDAVTTQNQAITNIRTMNSVFGQCGVQFQLENYLEVNPHDYKLSYGSAAQNELDQIRYQFHDPRRLLAVTTGPWGAVKNAWTSMPGEAIDGAVMEASIESYGDGIIYAHEFGHYLGLDHVNDTSNLMDAIIYTNSTNLYSSQCQTVRETAKAYWGQALR